MTTSHWTSALADFPDIVLADLAALVRECHDNVWEMSMWDVTTDAGWGRPKPPVLANVQLLGAMLPDTAPVDGVERLRALPFVETARNGLIVHEAVQQAIAAALRAAEPDCYREYRRLAWHQLRSDVARAGRAEL